MVFIIFKLHVKNKKIYLASLFEIKLFFFQNIHSNSNVEHKNIHIYSNN